MLVEADVTDLTLLLLLIIVCIVLWPVIVTDTSIIEGYYYCDCDLTPLLTHLLLFVIVPVLVLIHGIGIIGFCIPFNCYYPLFSDQRPICWKGLTVSHWYCYWRYFVIMLLLKKWLTDQYCEELITSEGRTQLFGLLKRYCYIILIFRPDWFWLLQCIDDWRKTIGRWNSQLMDERYYSAIEPILMKRKLMIWNIGKYESQWRNDNIINVSWLMWYWRRVVGRRQWRGLLMILLMVLWKWRRRKKVLSEEMTIEGKVTMNQKTLDSIEMIVYWPPVMWWKSEENDSWRERKLTENYWPANYW